MAAELYHQGLPAERRKRLYAGFQEHTVDVTRKGEIEVVKTETRAENCPQVLVALISSVGVGLTLTKATRVVLFEPSNKPTDEEQAICRAHRVTQTKPVKVWKFSCAGPNGVGSERTVKSLNSARNMFLEDGSLWNVNDAEAKQVDDQVIIEIED